jgi:hypothetical protein
MKLTTITAKAFKGLTFTLDLKDINFLVGSNFAGKTARTDAIRFLLLGYLPELGKTNVATFGLASGREMEVEGTFDNGLRIRRRLYLDGNSVKREEIIPGEIEFAGQLAVMLNAETYFALSDRERVNYVFANVQMGPEWSSHGILDKVNLALTDLPQSPPTRGKIITHLVNIRDTEDITPQAFVEEALAWLTVEAKSAKDYAQRMEKTTQGLAALRAQDPASINRAIADLDEDTAKIKADIETLQTSKAELQAQYNAIIASRKRRSVIDPQIKGLTAFQKQLETLRYRLGQKETHANSMERVDRAAVEAAHTDERQTLNGQRDAERDLKQVTESIEKNTRELDQFESMKACPCCGATGETWKEKKATEIKSVVAGLTIKQEQLRSHATTLRIAVSDIAIRRAELQRKEAECILIDREIGALKTAILDCERQIATCQQFADELNNLPQENQEITSKVDALQTSINVANSQLSANDRMKADAIAKQHDHKRLAEAETQRDQAKADLAIYVAAGKKLRDIQTEMVAAAFTPLLETANSFFGRILKTPIAYHDGEIGTWRGAGVWVTHRTLSGTEKALTYAAIQAALASNSPVRIMLLDELGRLDRDNAELLQEEIDRAITENAIDQFVGIDATNRYDSEFANCQIISVS